uniref:Uncharacterized protein n=1 Tax=Candidatus Methanogaster sp. ANME-2c ERB4 TaxID=2759911 RepID=A0A7G9YPR7_9EURY|nr:hypothetical protein CAGMOKBG_00021 [Methanosarcinales archaeon ANME-2c ERB4]
MPDAYRDAVGAMWVIGFDAPRLSVVLGQGLFFGSLVIRVTSIS